MNLMILEDSDFSRLDRDPVYNFGLWQILETRKRANQAAHELIAQIQSERKKEKEVHDKRVSAETGQGDV